MTQEPGLLARALTTHLASQHLNGAALKGRETAQNAQQSGFACAVAAQKSAAPARFQREFYFPKSRKVSVELPDIVERDDGHEVSTNPPALAKSDTG